MNCSTISKAVTAILLAANVYVWATMDAEKLSLFLHNGLGMVMLMGAVCIFTWIVVRWSE